VKGNCQVVENATVASHILQSLAKTATCWSIIWRFVVFILIRKDWWVLAYFGDLAALAARLRTEGLDVRNLGQVGITLWEAENGFFFPASELEENSELVARREFHTIIAKRSGSHRRPELRLAS
jgi:hypothetical protein